MTLMQKRPLYFHEMQNDCVGNGTHRANLASLLAAVSSEAAAVAAAAQYYYYCCYWPLAHYR